jgi:hypothetical protein
LFNLWAALNILLLQNSLNREERLAVHIGRAFAPQGVKVKPGGVALVPGKPVSGVELIHSNHQSVPVHFREH